MSRSLVLPPALEAAATPRVATIDVSVVIVTYNVRGFLEQALRSVEQASAGLEVETWVVDNDSADGSVEMVRERFPGVHVIANQENVGFAVANNQAIRQAAGRYILVLNPDTILQEDTLRELVAFMDATPDAGAAGCRILNPDGTFAPESRRAFPDPAIAFYRISGLSKLFPKSPRFGRYNLTYLPIDEVCEVDALSGSCMMVRAEAVLDGSGLADAFAGAVGVRGSRASDLEAGSTPSRMGGGQGTTALEVVEEDGSTSRTDGANDDSQPRGQGGAVSTSRMDGSRRNGQLRGRTAEPGTRTAPAKASASPEPRPAGLFDEGFFMYGEDLDWCYRIQQAGWRIYYTPSTQIVHYKGESTKKGDLRYVLLFYGAMLRFVEKHVAHRPGAGAWDRIASSALALGIRGGIVVRAVVAALGRAAKALAGPAVDFVLAWAGLVVTAFAWSRVSGFSFDSSYYGVFLPGYAAALVVSTAATGGYRHGGRPFMGVLGGLGLAGLAVPAVTYFVPALGISRAVIGAGLVVAAALLLGRRVWQRAAKRAPRNVLVVGDADEADRLRRLLDERLHGLRVVGYVSNRVEDGDVPYVGRPRQLRDLARLHGADDVVFASDSLTNTAILDGMRALRDLPVQLKILASGRDQIIGKASVEDYAAPLMAAERAVARLRPSWSRRVLEVPVACAFVLLGPAVQGLANATSSKRLRRLAVFASRMPSVLAGRRALVGYDPTGPHPPPAWGLPPGVVSVLDTKRPRPATITEAHRAYWFYARHQSAWLDLEVLFRALTRG